MTLLTLCANLCCCKLIPAAGRNLGKEEDVEVEDRREALGADANARCILMEVEESWGIGRDVR
jgi:hypothetical protein